MDKLRKQIAQKNKTGRFTAAIKPNPMPINKSALIRYKTIDSCLQNRFRRWTLEDLMEACSDALYEYEGMSKGISRRTIQLDLQNMRSEKLGYNAPIIVTDKKFYSYEDKRYSITNSPLTKQDLGTLVEVLDVLKQFKGFGYFQELSGMITRLEDALYTHQHTGRSYIDFEKNELLKGLQCIDVLHKAIINKKTIGIRYQSFKAAAAQNIILYPYLLKEYRNRWFILGCNKVTRETMILALDRIEDIMEVKSEKYRKPEFNVTTYFDDVIGVSKTTGQVPQLITCSIGKEHAPYIITKPLHASQKIIREEQGVLIFTISVIWNFELERELLGFGEQLQVLSPYRIKNKIKARLKQAIVKYHHEQKE